MNAKKRRWRGTLGLLLFGQMLFLRIYYIGTYWYMGDTISQQVMSISILGLIISEVSIMISMIINFNSLVPHKISLVMLAIGIIVSHIGSFPEIEKESICDSSRSMIILVCFMIWLLGSAGIIIYDAYCLDMDKFNNKNLINKSV